jgi:cell wall assembly regulator SMI1
MQNDNYTSLWQKWITAIEKIVPASNDYFNLKQGITDADVKTCESQLELALPEELITFYKVNNVTYNAIDTVFHITVNGYPYNLLPFNRIAEAYEAMADLDVFDEEDIERSYSDVDLSDKINVNAFTNPKWIPFAETDQGDYLLFDTDPNEKGVYGQIIEFQNDSWQRNLIASSIDELITNQIALIESGKDEGFDFILEEAQENESIENKSNISILNLEEAKKILPKESDYFKYTKNEGDNENYFLYIDGDYETDSIDLDNIPDYFETDDKYIIAIIINGNLIAKNIYNDETDGSCGIVTIGNLSAQNIVVGGQEIFVGGDLSLTNLYWGDYNHGSLQVMGKMNINILVDTDYSVPKDLYTLRTFNDERGTIHYRFSDELDEDFEMDIVKGFFIPEVLEDEDDLDEDEIYGWGSLVSRYSVLEKLAANETITLGVFDEEAYKNAGNDNDVDGFDTEEYYKNQREAIDNQPAFAKTTVTLMGIEFEVLRINDAEPYHDNLFWGTKTDKEEIGGFDHVDPESYFLLHKNPVQLKNLDVDALTSEAHEIDLFVAGLIFLSDIQIENQLVAQDLDTGPSFICLGNLTAKNIALFGNTYYVGGNVQCECLYGFYNHGSLYVNGTLQANLIIADDFALHASSILTWALVEESDWRVKTILDAVVDGELTGGKIIATLTQTHLYEDVLLTDILTRKDENGYSNYYAALLDYFEQGKTVFDFNKVQQATKARFDFLKANAIALWQNPYFKNQQSWADDDSDDFYNTIVVKPNEDISIIHFSTYAKSTQQLYISADNEMESYLYYADEDGNDKAVFVFEYDSKDILAFMVAFAAQNAIQLFTEDVKNKSDLSIAEEIEYNSQPFKIISIEEAQQLTKDIQFIDGSIYYDFEKDREFFSTPIGRKGVFLYADSECTFEDFNLVHTIEGHVNVKLYVLAVIFNKNVTIENALTSLNNNSAPAFIALKDCSAIYTLLEKGLHYIQGDFEGNAVVCKGTEGTLLIKGNTNTYFMYTEFMKIYATNINNVSTVISAQYYNPLVYHLADTIIDNEQQKRWYPCPNTNRLSDVAYDNWILFGDDSEVLIWKDNEGKEMYQEFLEGENIIDDDLAESTNYEEEASSYFDLIFNDDYFKNETKYYKLFHNDLTEIVCELIEEAGNRYNILCVLNHAHYFNLRFIRINKGENEVITAEYFKDKERNELESDFRFETLYGSYPLKRAIMYAAFIAKTVFENRDSAAFYSK